jgi:hypothetical protein
LDAETEQRILAARARHKLGPHQLAWRLGVPRSTVYAVLRRHGVNRLDRMDRHTGQSVRYQREHPGELVHVDVKSSGASLTVAAGARTKRSRLANSPKPRVYRDPGDITGHWHRAVLTLVASLASPQPPMVLTPAMQNLPTAVQHREKMRSSKVVLTLG